jgi:Na+/melibiose symporter-like transporter
VHSSVKIYLEIENLIGLGGVFNNKLDLWVLLKKGRRKGILLFIIIIFGLVFYLFFTRTQGDLTHLEASVTQ